MHQMIHHLLPWNVRELDHMIERAMLLCRDEEVESGDIAPGGALQRGNCILPRPTLAAHGRLSEISMSAQIETTSAFIGRNPWELPHCRESAKRSLRGRARCLVVDFGTTPNMSKPANPGLSVDGMLEPRIVPEAKWRTLGTPFRTAV